MSRLVELYEGWVLRRLLRRWTQPERRARLRLLYFMLGLGFLLSLVDEQAQRMTWQGFSLLIGGPWIWTNFALSWWLPTRLEFLDEMAKTRYGAGYTELQADRRKSLRRATQGWSRLTDGLLDERDRETRNAASARAFELLRRWLPFAGALYWLGYGLLRGGWRMILNPVAWLTYGTAFVLTLPSAIAMWNAKDEPLEMASGELIRPKPVAMEREV